MSGKPLSPRGKPIQGINEMETPSSPSARAADIANILHGAGAKMIASLPDNWIAPLIKHFEMDERFNHIPVNREESAVGLCSGAFFTGAPGVALMGASGFLTCIYAITKISYTYQIPMLFLITLRGAPGDAARFHVSNGLYLKSIVDAINMPAIYIEKAENLDDIGRAYKHAGVIGRPYVVAVSRDVLKGVR
jgi:sulfopyruvate decarboxylase TPP-binding subunit